MAEQQQHAPGGHYSGHNKIPTVNQFIERLDKDKKDRDAKIEEERKARAAGGGDAKPHQEQVRPKENQQRVRDPTTGKDVIIEDVNKDMIEASKNPVVRTEATKGTTGIQTNLCQLSVPNANLDKPTVSLLIMKPYFVCLG